MSRMMLEAICTPSGSPENEVMPLEAASQQQRQAAVKVSGRYL
jgi:hypothetical protein